MSKEGSPEATSVRHDCKNSSVSFTKRDNTADINVTVPKSDSAGDLGGATNSPVRLGTPSRKSDSSDSQKGLEQTMELGEKSFETSLNHILNKCSETSLDVATEVKDDTKKTDKKKKSTPWYSVSTFMYKISSSSSTTSVHHHHHL